MAKNQPHPNDPARQRAMLHAAKPEATAAPPLPTPPLRGQGLAGLSTLRTTLRHRAQRSTADRTATQQAVREAASDAALFRANIGTVTPLNVPARAATSSRTPPPTAPRSTCCEAAVTPDDSLSDAFNPAMQCDAEEVLYYHHAHVSEEAVRRLRSGAWNIQAQLDLHGMRSDEARGTLATFLLVSHQQGLRCLCIIHGKGLGSIDNQPVLKHKVQAWLAQKEEVMAFCEAPDHSGGTGAVLVLLQPRRSVSGKTHRAAP